VLGVVHGKIDTRTAEALIEPDKFRQYFQEPVGARKSRWHEFFNNLNETSLRELQTSMEIFREELIFILNNTDIQKDEAFEFIKRLSASIYSLNSAMARHDEVAPLSDFLEATPLFGFLWNVFAGWDWIEGYRKEDIVKKMIDEI